jgi:hypothetical protein
MVMTPRQQIATAFLAFLIVASVMSMPLTLEVPRERSGVRVAAGAVQSPTVTVELNHEQVKDLTYN